MESVKMSFESFAAIARGNSLLKECLVYLQWNKFVVEKKWVVYKKEYILALGTICRMSST